MIESVWMRTSSTHIHIYADCNIFNSASPKPSWERRSVVHHPVKNQYATETKTKKQHVNGKRSEATQVAGIMKDVNQNWNWHPERGAPQAENKDTSGLLKCENTLSSRKATASTAGDGELQHRTSLREWDMLVRPGKENLVYGTYHSLFWPKRTPAQKRSCHNYE